MGRVNRFVVSSYHAGCHRSTDLPEHGFHCYRDSSNSCFERRRSTTRYRTSRSSTVSGNKLKQISMVNVKLLANTSSRAPIDWISFLHSLTDMAVVPGSFVDLDIPSIFTLDNDGLLMDPELQSCIDLSWSYITWRYRIIMRDLAKDEYKLHPALRSGIVFKMHWQHS